MGALFEEDVPDDYVPFCRLDIGGSTLENVRFLAEVGRDHPFLIGCGDPYPKVWISALDEKREWRRIVKGDYATSNIGIDAEYANIQDHPEDEIQHGVTVFFKGNAILKVRAINADTAAIDLLDLRIFAQAIWLEGETLHIGGKKLENENLKDFRVLFKQTIEPIGLDQPYSGKGRPPTPARVQTYLRQSAGFGCCRCGHAIVHYHHIVPWEEKQHFDPDHMMAICPGCHEEMKVMSREDQYELKNKPHNIRRGFLDGQLVAPRRKAPVVKLGSTVYFEDCQTPIIIIDNTPILGVQFDEAGRALISLNLFDENDNLIAQIINNNWAAGSRSSWDFVCKPGYMKIKNKPNNILLEFDLKDDVLSFRGTLWKSGLNVWVKPRKIQLRKGTITAVNASYLSFIRSSGFRIERRGNRWVFGIGPMWF